MTSLHKIPTTDLFAELRRRELDERYVVKEMPSPVEAGRSFPTRWLVMRDGESERGHRGVTPTYLASCKDERIANDVAAALNLRADERRVAHAAPGLQSDMLAALQKAEAALDEARDNINPERGYCAELEARIQATLTDVTVAIHRATGD